MRSKRVAGRNGHQGVSAGQNPNWSPKWIRAMDHSIRHPTIRGLRADKPAKEVRREEAWERRRVPESDPQGCSDAESCKSAGRSPSGVHERFGRALREARVSCIWDSVSVTKPARCRGVYFLCASRKRALFASASSTRDNCSSADGSAERISLTGMASRTSIPCPVWIVRPAWLCANLKTA